MNKNILIVLGGAVVVAVLVALLVQLTLGGKEAPVVQQEAKVQILVADKDLSIGSELKSGDLRWQSWPKGALFAGATVRKEKEAADEVYEGRLARDVAKDEPFTKISLVGESKGNFVAASLEPGQRAVAIEVSASSMVGGFIGPGDYVDIVLTYKQTIRPDKDDKFAQQVVARNLDKMATETIVQNVKILAVDQFATRPEDDKIRVGKTITLALSVQDAERISLAQDLGALMLTLRGVGDDAIVQKSWPTISDVRLTTVDDEIFEEYSKNRGNGAGVNTDIMRIYNGDTVQTVPVH
ncbi:Flp pilus assembly protein CpaB [Alphaproteobacteria bacterium]|nr:Flp pilus assembly protein CpaB [Alphaproteobacteria bacterium]